MRQDTGRRCPVSLNRVVFSTNRVVRASVSANLVARLSALGVWMAVPAEVEPVWPCVELSYVDAVHGRSPLRYCVTGRFKDVAPVRTFRWSRGERHFTGWYWAARRLRVVAGAGPAAAYGLRSEGGGDRLAAVLTAQPHGTAPLKRSRC